MAAPTKLSELKKLKSFQLISSLYEIEWSDTLASDEQFLGKLKFDNYKITLQSKTGTERPDRAFLEVFYHEFAHALLDAAGLAEEARDEILVDRMGKLLFQFMTSCEYIK